jgi:hypothetical protein
VQARGQSMPDRKKHQEMRHLQFFQHVILIKVKDLFLSCAEADPSLRAGLQDMGN